MNVVPDQVSEAADLAEELHSRMFNPAPADDSDNAEPDDVEPAPVDDVDPDEEETYEKRYKTLKGKYEAEVPRLSRELRELKEDMFTRLQSVIDSRTPQPDTQVATADPSSEMLEQFAETYGEDFTDNIRKLIALEAKKLTGTVEEKVNSLEDTQFKSAQNNFVNYIDDKLKDSKLDWRACWQGDDPKFIEFLQKPDPSGLYTYGDLAKMYNEAWEADKLTAIFNLYEKETTPVTPPPKAESNTQRNNLVAPSRNTIHTAPDSTDKRIWTQDMIQEFQANDRMGKYSSEDSKFMWDDLLSALGENRIR